MSNKIRFTILMAVFVAIAVFEGLPERFTNWVKSDASVSQFLNQVSMPESLSGTLRGPLDNNNAQLTINGVIEQTNKQRELYKKNPLHQNSKLNLAAKAKVDDMFRQQYFEHESPDGKHPSDIVKAAGYDFLVVGENLALGNYDNDQVLVEAWMNSPGHRANILDGKFEEIGVAVGKGMFEGKEVWLAVQEFGTPTSSCPSPGAVLKLQIEGNRNTIDSQQAYLIDLKKKIDSNSYSNRRDYDAAVEQYNVKADELNKLIDDTKALVNKYNQEVNSFNSCLESDK